MFTEAKTKGEQQIDEAIKNSKRLSQDNQANAKSVVQKYLGGVSFSSLVNNWSGFGEISYQAKELQDADFEKDVQNEIDKRIEDTIKKRVESLSQQITTQYKAELDKALTQAENELVGDKDLQNQDGTVSTKGDDYDKLKDLLYKRPADDKKNEHTEVSTFTSSAKGAESKSQGYQNTVAYLEANGAKAKTKLVNGQEQTVYKINDYQGTRYVTVDDAGQVHELDKNKGFLRTSKFTTTDSIADAKSQTGLGSTVDVKVKVRNVDGQKQSVMTWKDKDGSHSRVIDHNEQSGITTSTDVYQVNAGGRAKYSSAVSGLSALADNSDDNTGFVQKPHRFQNGTYTSEDGVERPNYVMTQRGRTKLDKANIGSAIKNIVAEVKSKGINVPEAKDGVTIITINGHEYKLDENDNVSADRTMRLIKGEIARLSNNGNNFTLKNETVTTSDIKEDDRKNTNEATVHNGEKWRIGNGAVEGVGVDAPSTHTPSAAGKGKVNSVRYKNKNITPKQFIQEGWTASAGRAEEAKTLRDMDDIKGDGKSTRNLKNATEFAERFLKAKGQTVEDYNIKTLAAAIADANPSFFDEQGNMYRNTDFSRLNLPKKFDRYKNS